MSILIHNSLTNKKDEFVPIRPGHVGMYVCGITAYDECHTGHARSAHVFDVIRRYFRYRGYEVRFVKNITDIDDKIIDRAREEVRCASVKEKAHQIAEHYTERYHEDMRSLGIEPPDVEPKATEHIPDMLRAIEGLISSGKAYVLSGDVYFDVRAHPGYGKLSGQKIGSTISGERIAKGKEKRDASDFALWKSAKPDEPSWDSPWGAGRPGWHIECSVMSTKYLGANFDIHGGGRDLVFPHHENEIAQSEALTGKPFANYWIHNGLLSIDGQKMSKSLGNFVTIPDILRQYAPEALKLLFLGTHYLHPIDFSYEKMDEARSALERFYIFFDKLGARARASSADVENFRRPFINAMDDDFNAPQALAYLFGLLNQGNRHYDEGKLDTAAGVKDSLLELGAIFGLFGKKRTKESDVEIEAQIALRNEARKKRDFATADGIRKGLFEKGIILEDTLDGTTWRRA